MHQKGIREYLLCDCCEQKLNPWETYASFVLRGKKKIKIEDKGDHYLLSGIEYNPFKLFLMSLLWRAGIASDRRFESVDLAPHESQLRQLILAEDAGNETDYPCMLTALLPDNSHIIERAMMMPQRDRFEGHRGYFFVAAGLQWIFIVSSHIGQFPHRETFLKKTGELVLLKGNEQLTQRILSNLRAAAGRSKRSRRIRKSDDAALG